MESLRNEHIQVQLNTMQHNHYATESLKFNALISNQSSIKD